MTTITKIAITGLALLILVAIMACTLGAYSSSADPGTQEETTIIATSAVVRPTAESLAYTAEATWIYQATKVRRR